MKKFDRLPPEQRKTEIKTAAAALFARKGFSATTMENIVEQVSLSKGGVYRIYPSTTAILQDLMLDGMHLRNAFYARKIKEELDAGHALTIPFITSVICDSLLLYPEISAVYVEFLWEKRRSAALEALYRRICDTTVRETIALLQPYSADILLRADALEQITELMNAAILSLHVLDLRSSFRQNESAIFSAVSEILSRILNPDPPHP